MNICQIACIILMFVVKLSAWSRGHAQDSLSNTLTKKDKAVTKVILLSNDRQPTLFYLPCLCICSALDWYRPEASSTKGSKRYAFCPLPLFLPEDRSRIQHPKHYSFIVLQFISWTKPKRTILHIITGHRQKHSDFRLAGYLDIKYD
jgi:hypothetical protein